MKVLVANLGSTSFKYRLFDMTDERQLARGGIERIGSAESPCFVESGGQKQQLTASIPDHAEAVKRCLAQLTDPQTGCLQNAAEVAAIGFKAVHGGKYSGVVRVTPDVLAEMENYGPVAPAHNPPYVRAMRLLSERLPDIPLVAAFETGFHETIPARHRTYAVPYEWIEQYGIRRWGFHGASHRYIATRTAELLKRNDLRIISCHLGGSASLCAIRNGESVANSLGMSPQTGLPHNNRVGDFDPFALDVLIKRTGRTFDELLVDLANKSGLAGLSGTSGDMRDVEQAAAAGSARAKLAWDVFIGSVRDYLGAYLVDLGGADAIVFTGGIGEHGVNVRREVCRGLDDFGISLDLLLNEKAVGETKINAADSRTEIWVIPTNEELVVARQTQTLLQQN